jgi:tRNA A-37 threonylcarbamoyl transferase component Bud32
MNAKHTPGNWEATDKGQAMKHIHIISIELGKLEKTVKDQATEIAILEEEIKRIRQENGIFGAGS